MRNLLTMDAAYAEKTDVGSASKQVPNIVLILADDTRADFAPCMAAAEHCPKYPSNVPNYRKVSVEFP